MGILSRLFGSKKQEDNQLTAFETLDAEQPPEIRLKNIVNLFDKIPLPPEPQSGYNSKRAMMRLRDKLRGSLGFLQGGKDAFGNTPSRSGVGYILKQVCNETIQDSRWADPVKKAIGDKSWSNLSKLMLEVEKIGEQLHKK